MKRPTIKADCFEFTMRKKGTHIKVSNRELIKWATYINVSDQKTVKDALKKFNNAFRASLSTYKIKDNGNKAIAVKNDSLSFFSGQSETISGHFLGGITGIERTNSNRDFSDETTQDKDKISSLPCFYHIWIPLDKDLGTIIIMIQSYNNERMGELFLDQFKKYLSSLNVMMENEKKCIPKDMLDEYYRNSKISQISISKTIGSRSTRKSIHPLFEQIDGLKVQVSFSRFGVNLNWPIVQQAINNKTGILGQKIDSLGIDDSKSISIKYKYKGRETTGKLEKQFNAIPSIIINDQIEFTQKNHPTLKSLREYFKDLLEKIKKDLNYIV